MKNTILLTLIILLSSINIMGQTSDNTDFWKQGLIWTPNSTAQTTESISSDNTDFWKQGLIWTPNSTAQTTEITWTPNLTSKIIIDELKKERIELENEMEDL